MTSANMSASASIASKRGAAAVVEAGTGAGVLWATGAAEEGAEERRADEEEAIAFTDG